jgi:threonyl-tRNA synthetase
LDEPYKIEIINDRGSEPIFSVYRQGDWLDLCRGPHMPRTGEIKHFKLLKVAGAYWKGSEKNKMLSRIYGTAFYSAADLAEHLERLAEAEKRDHRRLGKDLELFSIQQEVGPGLILWHPKGARVRLLIEDYWRGIHLKHGYELVYTPHLARAEMWRVSGHTEFYQEYMYPQMQIEEQNYLAKPMNCPFHLQIYRSRLRSYRELPIRWAELGTVYRYERSGVLHGLMRVRGFTQDDAHLFMRKDQLHAEIVQVLTFTQEVLGRFGFRDFEIFLSTRPPKYVGSLANWDYATNALKEALESLKLNYQTDPGEGVFYGPKIDVKIRDSLKRSWQCSTIQVDFNLPERFQLEYVDQDGQRKQPIMVHRALLGSLERFFGILIEHYGGAFPFWLAPEQIRILTLSDEQGDYAEMLRGQLAAHGWRLHLDLRNEKLGFKIREAQQQKIPLMVIVGRKEAAEAKVSLRLRDGSSHNEMSLAAAIQRIQDEEKKI